MSEAPGASTVDTQRDSSLRTPAEYRASLRDGRRVFYRGTKVPDVTEHEVLRYAVDHAALDYSLALDAAHASLAVFDGRSRYGRPS
jgi:4-hydroxybutyryl-CoA dehydratase/vinylacetyl-CoA-Delta-isomerase